MRYSILGSIAFVFMSIVDWTSLRGFHRLKLLPLILAGVFLLTAWAGVLSLPTEVEFAPALSILGWLGLSASSFLLVFSILIEIPLRATYLQPGVSHNLITTGTYALTRHPGVLWFAGSVVSLLLISPSKTTLIAGGTWFAADILLVWVEDRYFFPQMFPAYEDYKLSTPFLWPNRASLQRCLATLNPTQTLQEEVDASIHYD